MELEEEMLNRTKQWLFAILIASLMGLAGCGGSGGGLPTDSDGDGAVSYTHLTLPTNREV